MTTSINRPNRFLTAVLLMLGLVLLMLLSAAILGISGAIFSFGSLSRLQSCPKVSVIFAPK